MFGVIFVLKFIFLLAKTSDWDEEQEMHGLNQNPVYISVHDFEASRAWRSYSLNQAFLPP